MFHDVIDSPVGALSIALDADGALHALAFDALPRLSEPAIRDTSRSQHVRTQVEQYFAGERRRFELELRPRGTVFQRRVWAELLEIPYGATASYGEIARRIGPDVSARAVGAANAANPIAIVIPCHRVIGADGSLTGYGGGLERKRELLVLEGAVPAQAALAAL